MDTRLRQQLSQRCQLVKQSAGSQARDWAQAKNMKRLRRHGFVEQPCRLLGLCVCTEYPDVVHMYRNVAAYFRGIFVKKKKIPFTRPCAPGEARDIYQVPLSDEERVC